MNFFTDTVTAKQIHTAATALMFTLTCFAATDFERDVWLYCDFDSPSIRIGGNSFFPEEPDLRNVVDGKFGKGRYFLQSVSNRLPPMEKLFKDGYPVKHSGGVFEMSPQPLDNQYPKWGPPQGGYICSCYASGKIGTELRLEMILEPAHTSDVVRVDTVVLTQEVQRVWTWADFDRRTVTSIGTKPNDRKVTFRITSSGPVTFDRFQYERKGPFIRQSNHPGVWVDGGVSRSGKSIQISGPELLAGFPSGEGACSFWTRSDVDACMPDWPPCLWGWNRGNFAFGFNGELIHAGHWWGGGRLPFQWRALRDGSWHHVAANWKGGTNAVVWIDGVKVAESSKLSPAVVKESDGFKMRIGCGQIHGNAIGDAVMDDFAIFCRNLTDAEVEELAKGVCPVVPHSRALTAEPVKHAIFNRNQENAAIRLRVVSPVTGKYHLIYSVADIVYPAFDLNLHSGVNGIVAPFDVGRLCVGKYPWNIRIVGDNGLSVLERSGEIEVLPSLDRDAFMYMNWGGNYPVSLDFMKTAGINTCNVGAKDHERINRIIRSGLFVNLRYENSGLWKNFGFGPAAAPKIAEQAEKDIAPVEGLHAWRTTLINSEVYYPGAFYKNVEERKDYVGYAREALGFEPDFACMKGGPGQFPYAARKAQVPTGVISETNACMAALKTAAWVHSEGYPALGVNAATAPVIRRHGGGTVWTEPISHAGEATAVDMLADWFYGADTRHHDLRLMRQAYAKVRSSGKAFMPTLGMYFDDFAGLHPTRKGNNGKPLKIGLAPSLDEYIVKCWGALGVTRIDALSVFSADTWELGSKSAREFIADPANTNAVKCVAEPDAPERCGEFIRTRFLPAAELLRGIETVRAPVALLMPSEVTSATGWWWMSYHYPRSFGEIVSYGNLPYDVIMDDEMKPEILCRYKYLIWPMAAVALPEHEAAVRVAAEAGTTVVFDKHSAFDYNSSVHLEAERPPSGLPADIKKTAGGPFLSWYTNQADVIRASLGAVSDCDDGNGYTFEKNFEGVRYVIVVNDARRPHVDGGFLTKFCTNEWYRPYGVSAKITTSIRDVTPESVVYEFNSQSSTPVIIRRSAGMNPSILNHQLSISNLLITADYAPSEGRVYCIYPEPLASPLVKFVRNGDSRGQIEIEVRTKSGLLAPGRTVVDVKVFSPDGALHDESGLCRCMNGRAVLKLYFSDTEPKGKDGNPWKVTVRDLTTGLCRETEFSR